MCVSLTSESNDRNSLTFEYIHIAVLVIILVDHFLSSFLFSRGVGAIEPWAGRRYSSRTSYADERLDAHLGSRIFFEE